MIEGQDPPQGGSNTNSSPAGNTAFIPSGEAGDMETTSGTCEHRWRYFVNVQARAIRVRECEHCGRRAVIPTVLEPLPRQRAEKLSA